MSTLREAIISELVKELKLPTVGRVHPELSRQAANEGWAYEDYLRELLSVEVQVRRERSAAQRIRNARFPEPKTFGQIEWDVIEGVSRPKLHELAACDFIERKENVVLAGPVGTGKTHLAIALGMEAALRRYRVLFVRAADMVRDLMEAKDSRQLSRMHQRMMRIPLLILDELGFVPFDRTGGELLFNLLSERHNRRSTILTTNLAFGEWVQVFGDEKLTTALLDRLAENSHVLSLTGESYRMKRRKMKS
jgi:DNA replication protein DnaC